jgi:Flp pilus assembly protein TadG
MRNQRSAGQAMVEFSLAILVFLVLVMAVIDFGMAVYKYNGVSEAAREIARVASVYQGQTFGHAEINSVVAVQKQLVPGLNSPTFTCIKADGSAQTMTSGGKCPADAYVHVEVTAPYRSVTPILGLAGTFTMKGSSSAQVHNTQ